MDDADVFGVRIAVGSVADSSNPRGVSISKQESDMGDRKKVRQIPIKSTRNSQVSVLQYRYEAIFLSLNFLSEKKIVEQAMS